MTKAVLQKKQGKYPIWESVRAAMGQTLENGTKRIRFAIRSVYEIYA